MCGECYCTEPAETQEERDASIYWKWVEKHCLGCVHYKDGYFDNCMYDYGPGNCPQVYEGKEVPLC
jgi:hypothetical protein